jgi:predicted nicotinamide N-methyase
VSKVHGAPAKCEGLKGIRYPNPEPMSIEPDLRRRFDVRLERFSHGGFAADLLLPRSADTLIDESEFNVDERLPYWAELWPSARALTRWLLDSPPPEGRVIELGCGVALPSLVLRARGVPVLATDYYAEALEFARANAERNGIDPPQTALLDWRHPPTALGRFARVIAADVLYERRNGDALAGLLPRLVAPGGSALLADPGRVHAPEFLERMEGLGWTVREEAALAEASPDVGAGVVSRVRLLRLAPAPGSLRSGAAP